VDKIHAILCNTENRGKGKEEEDNEGLHPLSEFLWRKIIALVKDDSLIDATANEQKTNVGD
jgi:hypothetical protein